MADEAILAELRRLSALIELAFRNELEAGRAALLADPLNRAIFKATKTKWVGSGEIQRRITNAGNSTIRERLSELADQGLLDRRGDGPAREFRSKGLI